MLFNFVSLWAALVEVTHRGWLLFFFLGGKLYWYKIPAVTARLWRIAHRSLWRKDFRSDSLKERFLVYQTSWQRSLRRYDLLTNWSVYVVHSDNPATLSFTCEENLTRAVKIVKRRNATAAADYTWKCLMKRRRMLIFSGFVNLIDRFREHSLLIPHQYTYIDHSVKRRLGNDTKMEENVNAPLSALYFRFLQRVSAETGIGSNDMKPVRPPISQGERSLFFSPLLCNAA